MFNFYTSGTTAVFSITGWFGYFLFVYLIIQLVASIKTKVFPFHRTFLFIKVLVELKKTKPKHWRFTFHNLLTPITISKKENGHYQVFIRTKSYAYDEWTCDWVIVNYLGKIVSEQLSQNMNIYDSRKKSDIIQYNRNKNLKNLGL